MAEVPTQTRPLITIPARDLSHSLGQVMTEVARGSVVRIVDFRSRMVRGYLAAEPPADVAGVANDGLAEAIGLPPRDLDAVKRCPACQRVKALTDFNRDSRRPDGCDTECKACRSARRGGNGA